MDIIKSEMAYLGYASTESYGISWKVRTPSLYPRPIWVKSDLLLVVRLAYVFDSIFCRECNAAVHEDGSLLQAVCVPSWCFRRVPSWYIG